MDPLSAVIAVPRKKRWNRFRPVIKETTSSADASDADKRKQPASGYD